MYLPFSFSPSSISQFRDCPRKFKLIKDKVITWKETPAKERGTLVHKFMEESINGKANATCPNGVDIAYTQSLIQRFRTPLDKRILLLEHEMCVTDTWKPCGWFDDNVLIRARADVLMLDPEKEYALIGDFKTGKIYPGMDLQVRVYALLCFVLYGMKHMDWELYYLDQGKTKSGQLDFVDGLAPVQDVLDYIHSALDYSANNNYFPANKNIFCRFCDVYHKREYCPESLGW